MQTKGRRLLIGIVAGVIVGTAHALVTHVGDMSAATGPEQSRISAGMEAEAGAQLYSIDPAAGQGGRAGPFDRGDDLTAGTP